MGISLLQSDRKPEFALLLIDQDYVVAGETQAIGKPLRVLATGFSLCRLQLDNRSSGLF
jgi:hypothetical protein